MAERVSKGTSLLGPTVFVGVLGLLAALGLWQGHYLLFHSVAELFSIVVACAILMLAWNTRDLADNDYLLFIGIGLFFVSIIDLLHTLAYSGTGFFAGAAPDLPTQLWLGARYLQALCLLAAPFFLTRRLPIVAAFVLFGLYVAAFLASVFAWHVFPACFVPGQGLTVFKTTSEYAICLALIGGLVFLTLRPRLLSTRVMALIGGAVAAMVASELAFTRYISVYGPANLVGHLLKIVAYYLLYKALVETALRHPLEVLFSGLKNTEHALRVAQHDLEDRVAARTEDLARTVAELEGEVRERLHAERLVRRREEQLRALSVELTQTEQRERRRLARVLHDHLQQLLAVAKLRVAVLASSLQESGAGPEALEEIGSLLDQSIESARSLTAELSPAVLYEAGLGPALEWLARQMERRYGLHVDVQAEERAEPRTEEISVLLFECTRELLFNVVKHAGVPNANVALALAGNGRCAITVSDEGNGFEPDETDLSEGAGGFGLFGIRERLHALGGRLTVRSAPGGGARLTVAAPMELLPSRAAPQAGAGHPETKMPRSEYLTEEHAGEGVVRIVLADDHEMMRAGLANLIEQEPDMVVVGLASDGEAAIDLVDHLRPDVIVMDVTMPRLSGLEATRIICERFPDVPVVGLTMHEETDMAAAMLSSGARAYLTKDGPPADLLAAIRACAPGKVPKPKQS